MLIALAGTVVFEMPELMVGLGLAGSEVLDHFRDGRRAQPIVERRIVNAFAGNAWRVVPACGGGRKLLDPEGQSWDVRVLVERLSFAPSWMKGTGRRFDAAAFNSYYRALAGAFVVDVSAFPRCPYWRVPSDAVRLWADRGELGARGSVSREDLPRLLEGFQP